MLKWLDNWMAKLAPADDKEDFARIRREALADGSELLSLLDEFPFVGPERARAVAAGIASVPEEKLFDSKFCRTLLQALVRAFANADADVRTTLAPAQTALNIFPTLRATLMAGGGSRIPFALAEGLFAMRAGLFALSFEQLGNANREHNANLTEDWSALLGSADGKDMLPEAIELASQTLNPLENPDLRLWCRIFVSIPGDDAAVINPDGLLLAAGDLMLGLHRAAGFAGNLSQEARRSALESADAHYKLLFHEFHPKAAEYRSMLLRSEEELSGAP